MVHVAGETDDPPLLEADPGTVTDFVDIPAGSIFGRPVRLEVTRSDAIGEGSRDISNAEEGDRMTVFAHGVPSGGETVLAYYRHDDDSWPEMPAGKLSLLIYPGALQPLPDAINGVAVATTDGQCLVDENGEERRLAWGGNLPQYAALDPGSTELAVAHFPGPGCELEPAAGTITIEGEAGQRFGLVPWGTGAGEIELMVLEMGTEPPS